MSISVWLKKQKLKNEKLEDLKNYFDKEGYVRCDVSLMHNYDKGHLLDTDKDVLKFIDASNQVKVLRRDFTDSLLQQLGPMLEDDCVRIQYEGSIFYKSNDTIVEEKQIGIELIGSDTKLSDLNILKLAQRLSYKVAGILVMSHSGYIKSLLSDLSSDERQYEKILKIMALKNKLALKELGLKDKVLKICLYLISFESVDLDKLIEMEVSEERIKILDSLKYFKTQFKEELIVDLSMSQKYEYYEGMICQVFVKGLNKSVIRGGRYLYAVDGKKIPAVGFSIDVNNYIERGKDENCII